MQRIGARPELGRQVVEPFYWEFAEEQARQVVALEDLPRSTDPVVRVVVFILGERLGEPIPGRDQLPPGFRLPAFIAQDDTDAAGVRLTYTAFEFIDWHTENRRRRATGEDPIPGFLYILGEEESIANPDIADLAQRNWGRRQRALAGAAAGAGLALPPETDDVRRRQLEWLDQFFDHYFRTGTVELPGLRTVRFIDDPLDFPDILSGDLEREFGLSETLPWRRVLRGLNRYEIGDRRVFFGREAELRQLAAALFDHDGREPARNVALVEGPSGTGKSSFVRAGLAGSIRDGLFASRRAASVGCVSPLEMVGDGGDIGAGSMLAQAIAESFPDLDTALEPVREAAVAAGTADALSALAEAGLRLTRQRRPEARLTDAPSCLVLVLDQAEQALDEIACDGPLAGVWRGVFALLLDLAGRSWFRLVVVLPSGRPDVAATIAHWPPGATLLSLAPYDRDGVAAIVGKMASKSIIGKERPPTEPLVRQAVALVDATSQATGAEGILPLVSQALYLLFEEVEGQGSRSFPALGDDFLSSSINRLFADVAASANAADDDIVSALLGVLVTFEPDTGRRRLTAAHRGALTAAPALGLWDAMAARGLLVPAGHGRYRLVHECVLDHWQAARKWLEGESALLHAFTAFVREARLWQAAGRDRDWDFGDATHKRLADAAQLLTVRRALVDSVGPAIDLPAYLTALIARCYDPAEDMATPDDRRSVIAWCAAAGLNDIVLQSVDRAGGTIDHLDRDGEPCLFAAAWRRHRTLVRDLLALGCRPDHPNTNGWRPLHCAAFDGETEIVAALLDAGADVEALGPQAQTPFLMAISGARVSTAQQLLSRGARIDAKDTIGWSALHYAARAGDIRTCGFLLDHGQDPLAADNEGWTPLHTAITFGGREVLTFLAGRVDLATMRAVTTPVSLLRHAVNRGRTDIVAFLQGEGLSADTDDELLALVQSAKAQRNGALLKMLAAGTGILDRPEGGASSALEAATLSGDRDMTRWLLEAGASPLHADGSGNTPLHLAVAIDQEDIVRVLLDHRADPQTPNGAGSTPLHSAVAQGSFLVVQLLCDRGADLAAQDRQGDTALHIAARHGQNAIAQLLMHRGADVETVNESGETPLHCTSDSGSAVVAGLILTRSRAPDVRSRSGATPLLTAARSGFHRNLRVLLEYGAVTGTTDLKGDFPLGLAAANGHVEVVELLLRAAQSAGHRIIDAADGYGWTALHLAARGGHASVVDLLLRHGADAAIEARRPRMSAVQIAAEVGGVDALRSLRSAGAPFDQASADKPPPLSLAIRNRQFDAAMLFLEEGAEVGQGDTAARTLADARAAWDRRRAAGQEPTETETLFFHHLVSVGLLNAADLGLGAPTDQVRRFWELHSRLVAHRGSRWAMPPVIPALWREPDAGTAARAVVAFLDGADLPPDLIERIVCVRSAPLPFYARTPTLYEARLSGPAGGEASLVFLDCTPGGRHHVDGRVRANDWPKLRVTSRGVDYLRFYLATLQVSRGTLRILDGADPLPEAMAGTVKTAHRIAQHTGPVRSAQRTDGRDTYTRLTLTALSGREIIECELDIRSDGSVVFAAHRTLDTVDTVFEEGFEGGLRYFRPVG